MVSCRNQLKFTAHERKRELIMDKRGGVWTIGSDAFTNGANDSKVGAQLLLHAPR